MKKIKFIAPLLAFALFSCDNYLDVNTSPNTLVYDEVTPQLLLPGAQVSSYRIQTTTMNQLGNVFMNAWTRNVQGFGNGFDRELQLTIDNSFYNGIWDGLYRSVNNFQGIIDYPNADGSQDYYVAIAKICKSHYLQYIVDLYGDAPYTEAFKGAANLTPEYDDDYAIYQDLIENLEDARNLIASADPAVANDPTAYDTMLHGDMNRWVEFANTIELRMLLRMSNLTGAQATYRDSKLATIVAGPFLSDNVSINPGFAATTNEQMNPFVNTFFYNVAGENQQNRSFIAMTGHAWKSLQSVASTNPQPAGSYQIVPSSPLLYPNLTDPRSARIFTGGVSGGAVGPRRAVIQGQNVVTIGAAGTTYPGVPSRLGALGHIAPYGVYNVSGATNAEAFAGADGFVMTYSESCFLLAEAAARADNGEAGYAGFTDAQSWFDEGIADNFAFRSASLGSYLSSINSRPYFGYTASTTFDQKLHAIMYQKWVALMGIHGIESFIEYNRTGYPLTPLSLNATQTRKPYRLIYPVSEYVANSANVPNMTSPEAFTINAKTPFWVQ